MRQVTLTRLIEEGLRRRLRGDRPQRAPAHSPLPTFKGAGGLRSGPDPTSNRSMLTALDDDAGRQVLVAAFRADHPHYVVARDWFDAELEACRQGGSLRPLPMAVAVASFLRLVTSTRVFVTPAPTDQAVGFIDALLSSPGVEFTEVGTEWPQLRQLCLDRGLTGNDLPDAWIAAAVAQQGEHPVSFDRDFELLLDKSQWTLLGAAP